MTAIKVFNCLVFLATVTSAVKIQCRYSIINWADDIEDFYTCTATAISEEDPTTVTALSGNHMEERNDADVKAFAIADERILTSIPNGVENFFADLKAFG